MSVTEEPINSGNAGRASIARSRTTGARRNTGMARLRRLLLSDYFVLYLTLFMYISAAILLPILGRSNTLGLPTNVANQLLNMWPLLAVAIGQTFVLILGGIDLSVGATMGLSSVVGAIVMASGLDAATFDRSPLWNVLINENGGLLAGSQYATAGGVAAMLLVGLLIGLFNGLAITRFNLAPFMVTLVSMIFFGSFALWLTASRNISGLPEDFIRLGTGDIISVYLGPKAEPQIPRREILPFITYPFLISIGLAIFGQWILSRTVFGRQMFAIGANRRAAEISGIPSKRVIVMVYMFSGMCAAIAAILYSARLGIGQPSLGGGNLLLDVIGAAVIGGTSLFGGKGSVRGTVFGVAFFVLLLNVLNAMQLSPFIIDSVKGLMILIAALLDITRTRLMNQEQQT